jgi:hypothetical protein
MRIWYEEMTVDMSQPFTRSIVGSSRLMLTSSVLYELRHERVNRHFGVRGGSDPCTNRFNRPMVKVSVDYL